MARIMAGKNTKAQHDEHVYLHHPDKCRYLINLSIISRQYLHVDCIVHLNHSIQRRTYFWHRTDMP
jgi:hypothetical protein